MSGYDLELPRAIFDETRVYRYLLRRHVQMRPTSWRTGRVLFVLTNPSKADEELNDPTVRRIITFARTWGFSMLELVNAFALRATDPVELSRHPDPIGPENDRHILEAVDRADLVVCGWGDEGRLLERGQTVLSMIQERQKPWLIRCLDVNISGEPKHPLYVRRDAGPVTYPLTPPAENTYAVPS